MLGCQSEKAFKVYFRTSGALTALLQYTKQLFELFAIDLTATIAPPGINTPSRYTPNAPSNITNTLHERKQYIIHYDNSSGKCWGRQ